MKYSTLNLDGPVTVHTKEQAAEYGILETWVTWEYVCNDKGRGQAVMEIRGGALVLLWVDWYGKEIERFTGTAAFIKGFVAGRRYEMDW